MGSANRLRSEIKWDIGELSDEALQEVADFIRFLIHKNSTNKKRSKTVPLKDCLANTDLANLDIEKEIKDIRKKVSANIEAKWQRQNM